MTTIQIAVNNSSCYQFVPGGLIKLFEEGSAPPRWTTIDNNPDNVQVVAGDYIYLRHKDGLVYRRIPNSWTRMSSGADRLWSRGRYLWQWGAKGNAELWERPLVNATWSVIDQKIDVKDVVLHLNKVYQLRTDGKVYRGEKSASDSKVDWRSIDDSQTEELAEGRAQLYQRRKNNEIYQYDGNSWILIGSDTQTIQIAAGDAGLYQLHKDGSIYHHMGGTSWDPVDPSPDNASIAVSKFVYRVTTKGGIYRLIVKSGEWQKLQDPIEEQGTNGTASSGATDSSGGIRAEQLYDGGASNSSEVRLRVGNGGAGQTGLLKSMADAFIRECVKEGIKPFKIAWYKSDTTETIRYLKDGIVDVGITYTPAAEKIAMEQGIATMPKYPISTESLLLIGPPSDPANIREDKEKNKTLTIEAMFGRIYGAAEAENTKPPVRFLSRYDKSATNLKDSELWIKIGQTPWANSYSKWYHQYVAYPIQAFEAAAVLQEYTITDYGTYLAVPEEMKKQVEIFKKGTYDMNDTMQIHSSVLIGAKTKDPALAKKFAEWLVSANGQATIMGFSKSNEQMYNGGMQIKPGTMTHQEIMEAHGGPTYDIGKSNNSTSGTPSSTSVASNGTGWRGPGVYVLTSAYQSLNLDLNHGGSTPGTTVQGWTPYQQHKPQTWCIDNTKSEARSPPRFTIANLGTKTVLTNLNAGSPHSNQIVANPFDPTSAAQSWEIDTATAGNGLVIIRSVGAPGQVLDLKLSYKGAGAPVLGYHLYEPRGNQNQHWKLTRISDLDSK